MEFRSEMALPPAGGPGTTTTIRSGVVTIRHTSAAAREGVGRFLGFITNVLIVSDECGNAELDGTVFTTTDGHG